MFGYFWGDTYTYIHAYTIKGGAKEADLILKEGRRSADRGFGMAAESGGSRRLVGRVVTGESSRFFRTFLNWVFEFLKNQKKKKKKFGG